jgi:putative transposase
MNKPVYVVIGVTVNGERDILGLWAGDGGEGAKFWLSVFCEIKNRGVKDLCIAVCDGLKGLPEAITTTWELATVQACVIHLIRNTFRFASRKYWDEMSRDLRPVYYGALREAAARERFVEFDAKWGKQYPAISKLWENAWNEFIPFQDYDVEIRRVICSTNAIESLNAPYRRAVRAPEDTPPTTPPR